MIEVQVEVRAEVDLDGNARIGDKKIVANRSDSEMRLRGPFHQTIHSEVDKLNGRDSDGNALTCKRNPISETRELELHFSPPFGDFIIPRNTTKWFKVEYTAYAYAERVGDGLLFRMRAGNLKYHSPAFSGFTYSHTYVFDLRQGRNWLHRAFNKYEPHLIGFNGKQHRSGGKIIITTSKHLHRQESQTHFVFLEPHYRKWLTVLLSVSLGVGLTELLRFIVSLI